MDVDAPLLSQRLGGRRVESLALSRYIFVR
jgi:hypothetical protein